MLHGNKLKSSRTDDGTDRNAPCGSELRFAAAYKQIVGPPRKAWAAVCVVGQTCGRPRARTSICRRTAISVLISDRCHRQGMARRQPASPPAHSVPKASTN